MRFSQSAVATFSACAGDESCDYAARSGDEDAEQRSWLASGLSSIGPKKPLANPTAPSASAHTPIAGELLMSRFMMDSPRERSGPEPQREVEQQAWDAQEIAHARADRRIDGAA